MLTNKAIEQIAAWAEAAAHGDPSTASQHLREFYHRGAALTSSPEFQKHWRARHGSTCDWQPFDHLCQFLETIAAIEAQQVRTFGRAA